MEESQGFKSFGRTCDELYNNINPEDFKSIEEVKTFVAKNSEYLQLIEDENGELTLETVLFKNPNRYLVGKNKMFKINKSVYRIFDDATVMTKEENIEKLRSIEKNSISMYKSDPDFIFMNTDSKKVSSQQKNLEDNCGKAAHDYRTEGRDRTHMWLECGEYFDELFGTPITYFSTNFLIRPYKRTLGIWYWCSRTISCDVKIAADWYNGVSWVRDQYLYSELGVGDSKIEHVFASGTSGGGHNYWRELHFGGYDAWGATPSAPAVVLQCNTSVCN
jgi:hypothetical protein